MSNYVDPEAVRPPIPLPCTCPGTPHEKDYVTIVQQFGYGSKGIMRRAAREQGTEAYNQKVIELGVKAWTFVLPDGKPRPVDAEQIARLDEPTVELLLSDSVLGAAFIEDEATLPNGSGAPSLSGSQGSATSTRKRRVHGPSTTS